MTSPSARGPLQTGVIDGVDVDAVAAAVLACADVAGLDGGQFGEVASYLPGRVVTGVVVSGGRVRVQICSRWGVPVAVLAAQITRAVRPLTGPRPVDIVIADIEDPPGPAPRAAPAGGASRPPPTAAPWS